MKLINLENIEKIARFKLLAVSILMAFVPLLVITNGYFPYVLYKAVIVQFLAVVTGLIYGFLLIGNWQKYKPGFSWLSIFLLLWLGWLTVSSVINGQFKLSFFGDWRQAEGLFLLWSLFVWMLAVVSVLEKKQILAVVKISSWTSALVALLAFLQIKGVDLVFLPLTERVTSTLGNAGYLATYSLLSVGLAGYVFINNYTKSKYVYLLIALINVIALFLSGTRGAILGLIAGLVLGLIFLSFSYFKNNKKITKFAVGVVLTFFVLLALGFVFKDSLPTSVKRVFTWSGDLTTIQTRLSIWRSGWQALKEKPVLGYGYENFGEAFNSQAEVRYYQLAPTETWVSRAHNTMIDNAIYGGWPGLILYALVWLTIFYTLWKRKDDYKTTVVLAITLFAYFVQGLFIFDSVATFFLLFFILALVNFKAEKNEANFKSFNAKALWLVPLSIVIIVWIGLVQLQTWKAGVNLLSTINWLNKGDAQKANELYQKIGTYKNRQDIEVAIVDNLAKVVAQKDVTFYEQEDIKKFLYNLINNFEKNFSVNNAEHQFFYQRSLLITLEVDNNEQIKNKLITSLSEARKKYPNNPQFLWLQIALAIQFDNLADAEKYSNEAIAVFPDNSLGYWYKSLIEFSKKEDSEMGFVNALIALEKGYVAPLDENWQRLYNYFYSKKDWLAVEKLLRVYVQQEPDDRDGYINLSDAIARQGKKEEAKQLLRDLIKTDKGATDDVYVQIQKINQME